MAANYETFNFGDLPEPFCERIRQGIADFQNRPRPRIALVGRTGVGKSSGINFMRGLSDIDEGAAPVSDIGESCIERQVYTYFGIDFEDLPGSDGVFQELPLGEQYIAKFQLDKADAILLLWERALDKTLADCAKLLVNKHRRPVFFIRTKMDFVSAQAAWHGLVDADENVMNSVRERARQEMTKFGLAHLATPERLYLVSTQIVHKHRFDGLRLLQDIPTSIHDEAAASRVKSLFTTGLDGFIAAASKNCRNMIPYYCLAAGACGAVPVPGSGAAAVPGLLLKATHDFTKEFGLTLDAFPQSQWASMVKDLSRSLAAKVSLLVAAAAGAEMTNSSVATAVLAIPFLSLAVEMVGGAAINVALTKKVLNLVIEKLAVCAEVMYSVVLQARMSRAILPEELPQILDDMSLNDAE